MRNSVLPKNQRFVKVYGFLYFAKSIGKRMAKYK